MNLLSELRAKLSSSATMVVSEVRIIPWIPGTDFTGYWPTHELKQKQVEILKQMELHERADENYYIQLGRLLELASRAYELFTRSKVDQKRRLLQSLLSNLTLSGKKLSISLQEPYNLIFEHASRQQWLPGVGSNHRPIGYIPTPIS